jgi:hypothetical protein
MRYIRITPLYTGLAKGTPNFARRTPDYVIPLINVIHNRVGTTTESAVFPSTTIKHYSTRLYSTTTVQNASISRKSNANGHTRVQKQENSMSIKSCGSIWRTKVNPSRSAQGNEITVGNACQLP